LLTTAGSTVAPPRSGVVTKACVRACVGRRVCLCSPSVRPRVQTARQQRGRGNDSLPVHRGSLAAGSGDSKVKAVSLAWFPCRALPCVTSRSRAFGMAGVRRHDGNETAARAGRGLDVGGRTSLDRVKARSGLWRSLSACLEAGHAAPTEARRGSKGTAQRSCTE